MNHQAWRSLAPGLVAGALLVGVGSGFLIWSVQNLQSAQEEAHQAQVAAVAAKVELARLEHEAPRMGELFRRLDALLASELAVPPDRVEWLVRLRELSARTPLSEPAFELAPTRNLGSLDTPARYTVRATRMKIEAALAHEGKLPRLLHQLESAVPGQLHPVSCVLERPETDAPDSAGLRLRYEFDWLNIVPPSPDTEEKQARLERRAKP